MKKGDVPVDWIIGFFIFIIFISWSFQYYSTLFRYKGTPLDQVALGINSVIIGNISNNVYEVPVTYTSPDQITGVMHAYYSWSSDDERRTTIVFSNVSAQLPCEIDSDVLYWQSDVVAGQNNFTIRVSNRTEPVMNCTGIFDTTGSNLTLPRAGDLRVMLSQDAIDTMMAASYDNFKTYNGINRDFRIMFEATGGTTAYGSVPPNTTNVFSEEKWYKVEETNGNVKITTLIW
jgi:hypothetical protein